MVEKAVLDRSSEPHREQALAAIQPYIDRVLAGEHVEYERLVRYAGMGERWVRNLFSPTRDGSSTSPGSRSPS